MQVTNRSVEDYLKSVDETYRDDLRTLHKAISEHMPAVAPKLWEGVFWGGSEQSIIGYGDLEFTRSDKKKVEWFSVGLTCQKNYISIYIIASEDGQYVVKKYADKLGKVKVGSSSVSFKRLVDVELEELLKLVDIARSQIQ